MKTKRLMNKKMYKKILLGGLSLLVLAGCQKGLFENNGGRAVSFTANSGAITKAAYGDAVGGKQRIEWQAGDSLVIFSDRAETPQGQKSLPEHSNHQKSHTKKGLCVSVVLFFRIFHRLSLVLSFDFMASAATAVVPHHDGFWHLPGEE